MSSTLSTRSFLSTLILLLSINFCYATFSDFDAPGSYGSDEASDNPISFPTTGSVLVAGQSYTISWTPTTGDLISIELWTSFPITSSFYGANCNFDDYNPSCSQLVQNTSNSGSFVWNVPSSAPESSNYFLDLYVPDAGWDGPFYFTTGNFTITGGPQSSFEGQSASASVQGGSTTPTRVHSMGYLTPTVTIGAQVTAAVETSSSGLSGTAIGGIVGAVIGGGILITLTIALFFIFKRRKITRRDSSYIRQREQTNYIPSGRIEEVVAFENRTRSFESSEYEKKFSGGPGAEEIPVSRIRYPEPDELEILGGRTRSEY